VAEQDPEDAVFRRRIQERLARLEENNKKKKPSLQRSSSDVTEQRLAVEKTTKGVGLRKTTSAVMSRLDSPEDPALTDFQFPDALDLDDPIFDDPVIQPPVVQLPVKPSKEPAGQASRPTSRAISSITARSFKPLVVKPSVVKPPIVKPASVPVTRPAPAIVVEKKKDEDIGPWSKEAFDLMDWRPPNMLPTKAAETA
jgi:hypothetical protein